MSKKVKIFISVLVVALPLTVGDAAEGVKGCGGGRLLSPSYR